MISYCYALPAPGTIRIAERDRVYLDYITRTQLKNEALWHRFADVFRTKQDVMDLGWRGEYWGKMMRGACLVYRCTKDEALYAILLHTVQELLACAEPDGRISTYPRDCECSGWDLWCRKYVLTGMLHFCDICQDPALVETILDAMERHLDCLIEQVGDGPGQKPITETSDYWLGVNSCSILEPVLDLYRRRLKPRFLAFAEYIIGTGGCSGGDLIALALQNEVPPYRYPENKAYETMSFFEGVLAYYEITGKEDYLRAVRQFAEKVYETEITLIGCAGCAQEQFDHAVQTQTEPSDKIMQETCVTVTWMRLCARLYLVTGEERYAERVEQSALNALYSSVNLEDQPITVSGSGEKLAGLPFDSYSPLYMNTRGREVGGLKFFRDGSFYGCCAAIGAAGLAVYPLIQSLRTGAPQPDTLAVHRRNGKIAFTYGPYVLARDSAKELRPIDGPVRPVGQDGTLRFSLLACEGNENVRLLLETEEGSILLTDYASCGKRWSEDNAMITVWMRS